MIWMKELEDMIIKSADDTKIEGIMSILEGKYRDSEDLDKTW